MNIRRMLVVGIMVLMTICLWAQTGAEGGRKKAAAGGEKNKAAGGGAVQALIDIENKWVAAGMKQDPAMLEPYLADGFVSMDSSGACISRKDYLAGIKTAKWEI